MNVFEKLGMPARPVILAPLAGVSDHPFRRICTRAGADLVYVEMLSAAALVHNSRRTYAMLERHPRESKLGVQLTGSSAELVQQAVAILSRYPFETVDINMGCPVAKVVRGGSGSAILKDPARVYDTVRLARMETDRPISVKIRIGWDQSCINTLEVADAAARGGAAWITIHGRTRSADYADPVNLAEIIRVKRTVNIPVIGNGNLFSRSDTDYMQLYTGVDGLMVSRGALGNPWVFREIKTGATEVTLTEWRATVIDHLNWQADAYGQGNANAAVCMRKHLLWYGKGWPHVKKFREAVTGLSTMADAMALVDKYAKELEAEGVADRHELEPRGEHAFIWNPKGDMDRQVDRGVGEHDGSSDPSL